MQHGSDTRRTALLGRHVLEQIVASSAEAVVVLDARGADRPVLYANPAFEALCGLAADALVGQPWARLGLDGAAARELAPVRAAIERAELCCVSVSELRWNGGAWSGEIGVQPLSGADGRPEFLLCQCRLVAAIEPERRRSNLRLLRHVVQAPRRAVSLDRTDPVTGLLRYEHFMMLLGHDLGIARRERHPLSLLAFEVVELDVYRATFGAKAADSCLRMIGTQVLGAFRRAGDSCARCDEAVVLAAVLGQEPIEAARVGEHVVAKVRRLSLHNPRGRLGRQLWMRHVVVGADPGIDDAKGLVERARTELKARAPRPAETRSAS